MTEQLLVVLRLLASCIFAVGSIYLAAEGKEGWGWFIFASIWLGAIE